MKHLPLILFMLLVNRLCGLAQTKPIELIWQMDTSSFSMGGSFPFNQTGEIKQVPMNLLRDAKTSWFKYSITFGDEKLSMHCCLQVSVDSAHLAIDKNFDSIFQDTEIFKYTLDQYKNENLGIHFSVKKQDYLETYFLLGSIKKTSIKVNTPDSLLNLNPLILKSKNYLRSSFMEGGEMVHLILMNTFPAMGIDRNYQYLVTKNRVDDSVFSKITNWSQSTDTVFINEQQAIVSSRYSEGGIRFSIIDRKNLFGTFIGSKMPKLTVTNIENSIVQLPINQPGKYNLIEFWGTWCGPCTALYPRLDSVLKANAHILSYTGITGHDDKEKMLRYISKKPTIKNQVFEPDKNKSIVSLFKITAFPTFILVDDKGIIVAKKSGSAGLDVVEKLINEAGARQIKSSKTD
jgi:thiol-disulfide isomerase/thioredoxin